MRRISLLEICLPFLSPHDDDDDDDDADVGDVGDVGVIIGSIPCS